MTRSSVSRQPDEGGAKRRVALVEARQIARSARQRGAYLLHPADFALHAGECVVLTGPSGSGKSVFLRALALLDPLDGGTVLWRGEPVPRASIPRFRRHIAYLRQRPALLDGTVEDNLRYPYTLCAYRDAVFDVAHARSLLDAAHRPSDFLARHASELSGGEAQIVALVRVLQLDPDALLLDEPTASLDPDSAQAVEALVGSWIESQGAERATVWVSHDPAQAARVGSRHVTMNAGVLDAIREAAPVPARAIGTAGASR